MNDLISGGNKSGQNVFVDFSLPMPCLASTSFSLRHQKDNRTNILGNITGTLEIQAKFALGDHVLKLALVLTMFGENSLWGIS